MDDGIRMLEGPAIGSAAIFTVGCPVNSRRGNCAVSQRPGAPASVTAIGRAWRRAQRSAICSVLSLAFLGLFVRPLLAQVNDARNDGNDARYDALLSTPNAYTPTPQDNLFATAPGLEQQAPRSQFTANGVLPITYNSNPAALPSGGASSAEISPLAGLSWATPVADLPLRFSATLRTEFDRFPNTPDAAFDKLVPSARLQYVDPDNDQAYSPFLAYASRVDFMPTFSTQFATRHDLRFGFNKTFNFDADFSRVAFSGNSSGDTVWSFGLTTFFQERFRDPAPGSTAEFIIPSVSYVISPQWNFSGGLALEHYDFESVNDFSQTDWFIEPIATLEFVIPSAWFGAGRNAVILGRPSLDFQVAYEKNWSNLGAANFNLWNAGAALKLGWRF
jgi:hypothetical protein